MSGPVRSPLLLWESMDHWINQVWSEKENRWVTFEADGLGTCGLKGAVRHLFYDLHSLMNHEISYLILNSPLFPLGVFFF